MNLSIRIDSSFLAGDDSCPKGINEWRMQSSHLFYISMNFYKQNLKDLLLSVRKRLLVDRYSHATKPLNREI